LCDQTIYLALEQVAQGVSDPLDTRLLTHQLSGRVGRRLHVDQKSALCAPSKSASTPQPRANQNTHGFPFESFSSPQPTKQQSKWFGSWELQHPTLISVVYQTRLPSRRPSNKCSILSAVGYTGHKHRLPAVHVSCIAQPSSISHEALTK